MQRSLPNLTARFAVLVATFAVSCVTSYPEPPPPQPTANTPEIHGQSLSGAEVEKWLAEPVPALAKGFKGGRATVRAVIGTADFASPGRGWQPARLGMVLAPGDAVRTGEESSADLFLRENGPVLRLCPDSVVRLGNLQFIELPGDEIHAETLLELRKGRLLGNVRRRAAGSKYEIQTPAGLARIHGGDYDIEAAGHLRIAGAEPAEYIVAGKTNLVFEGQPFGVAEPPVKPPARNCEIHHVPMRWEEVPISYGLVLAPRGYFELRPKWFPHSGEVLGGCVVGLERMTWTFVCPKCREASVNWRPDPWFPSGQPAVLPVPRRVF